MFDFIFDIIIEGILWTVAEKLCYLFCSLAFMFIPVKKRSKKTENIVKLIGVLVGLSMLVLWVIGIVELFASDARSILGWVFTIVSNSYIFVSVLFGGIADKSGKAKKKNKEEK